MARPDGRICRRVRRVSDTGAPVALVKRLGFDMTNFSLSVDGCAAPIKNSRRVTFEIETLPAGETCMPITTLFRVQCALMLTSRRFASSRAVRQSARLHSQDS